MKWQINRATYSDRSVLKLNFEWYQNKGAEIQQPKKPLFICITYGNSKNNSKNIIKNYNYTYTHLNSDFVE